MPTFADRVFSALGRFNGHLTDFTAIVRAQPPSPPRPSQKDLNDLLAAAERAGVAAAAIAVSITHIAEQRGVDIVDMQVRLKSETARLASALSAIGKIIEGLPVVPTPIAASAVGLDEAAQLVAAAIFPSAVKGLREVNVKLWEFQKIQQVKYGEILSTVVQRQRITPQQQARIEEIGTRVIGSFDAVNVLLNELAEGRPGDTALLRQHLKDVRAELDRGLQEARRRMTDAVKMFKRVIDASAKIADDVIDGLDELVIPVYPSHAELGVLTDLIDDQLYDNLSGVQVFALLNISARMQHTTVAGQALLSTAHAIRVTHVFPDRIYLEASESLLDAVRDNDDFDEAPAALHRFNDVSYKQTTSSKGNLQLSFAARANSRVAVDADIDLYRLAVPHLFGEVLVNHLTGSTTDQFAVRRILDDQQVPPIGGFEVVTA